MFKVVFILATLLFLATSLTTYTNSYLPNIYHPSFRLYYSLGQLNIGDEIVVRLSLAETSGADRIIKVSLYDESGANPTFVTSQPGNFHTDFNVLATSLPGLIGTVTGTVAEAKPYGISIPLVGTLSSI